MGTAQKTIIYFEISHMNMYDKKLYDDSTINLVLNLIVSFLL